MSLSTIYGERDSINVVGGLLFVVGFLFESIADFQKSKFHEEKKDGTQSGAFISTGLWALCQYPNYFGEIVLQTGIALCAMSTLGGWLSLVPLVTPVFVTFLLLKVSGVPLLKKLAQQKYANDPKYQEYVRKTPELIPFTK